MKKTSAGLQYWLLCIGIWMVAILTSDIEYPLTELFLYSILGGYITALFVYNIEDYIRYFFKKIFSATSKVAPYRIKKPKFRFKFIPDIFSKDR